MRKILVFWMLIAALFAASASAQTAKSDTALPVTMSVSKMQMDKPVRGKMMFTITYKNISSKPRNLFIFVIVQHNLKLIKLTIPEFPKVKPTGTHGYQLEVYGFKPGASKVIHVYMPKLSSYCYVAKLYVQLDNKEWGQGKLQPVSGCKG